jgi:hypothetical protein
VVGRFRIFSALALLLLPGLASQARADLIVVNPNDFASGTDLSTMFHGVTMAHLRNEANQDGPNGGAAFRPVAAPVYAISTYHDPTTLSIGGMGIDVDAYDACSRGVGWQCSWYDVLEVRFDDPTNFFQIDSVFYSDGPSILAFDVLGNRIYDFVTTYSIRPDYSGAATITLTHATSDIARVVYGGVSGNATPTRISYNVPEPLTLGFMSLGLAAAGLFARRRQRQVSE